MKHKLYRPLESSAKVRAMTEQGPEIPDSQQLHALARRQRNAAIGHFCRLAMRKALQLLFRREPSHRRDPPGQRRTAGG